MKKLKQLLALLLTIGGVTTYTVKAFAEINDVINPEDPSQYIKVTLNHNKTAVNFKHCRKMIEGEGCIRLGRRDWYTFQELGEQQVDEYWKATLILDLDALIIIASGGTIGMGASLLTALAAASEGALIALTVGAVGTATGGVLYAIDEMNPLERFRRAENIRVAVVTDQDVETVQGIKEFAERLEIALNNID